MNEKTTLIIGLIATALVSVYTIDVLVRIMMGADRITYLIVALAILVVLVLIDLRLVIKYKQGRAA